MTAPQALRRHWREYLIEAGLLGGFMLSASGCATLLFHPASPVVAAVPDPLPRRALMGLAMGATLAAFVYSPWGRRSGAHMNPATTLACWRLGRVAPWDAAFYPLVQLAGAMAGMGLAVLALGRTRLGHPAVAFVATRPGNAGALVAFVAELASAGLLMWVVLETAASPRLARRTGLFAAGLLAFYILAESPFSGTSMNPARSFASDLAAGDWRAFWVYCTAPVLGMQLAALAFVRRRGARAVPCAKYRHIAGEPCIFCDYAGPPGAPALAHVPASLPQGRGPAPVAAGTERPGTSGVP